MKKKYNPEKVRLHRYEQSIDDAINYEKMRRPTVREQTQVKAAASKTLRDIKRARSKRS